MGTYLVDTTVFVSHFRGDQNASKILQETKDIRISFVTAGELLQGARNKKETQDIIRFLQTFDVEWGSGEINELAIQLIGEYHTSHGLLMVDALQAGTCLVRGYTFVTDNLKHFSYFPKLSVISPKDIF